jgi:hypothetical protein
MNQLATQAVDPLATISPAERALLVGDLSQLKPDERASLVMKICDTLGLNPYTKPFEYIVLQGKMTLYARKDCTDQLRSRYNVSVKIASRGEIDGGIYAVTSLATLPNGRTDESLGAVPIKGLNGEALCNAVMKAETKSKRRVTLSICGLGILDESELDTIQDVQHVSHSEQKRLAVVSKVTALPPVTPSAEEAQRPKSGTELAAMFSAARIPGSFAEWLVLNVAPDLKDRKKKVLSTSEALEAAAQIAAYLEAEEATISEPQDASGASDDVSGVDEQTPPSEAESIPIATTPKAKPISSMLKNLMESVAAEINFPEADMLVLAASIFGDATPTNELAERVCKEMRDSKAAGK